MPFLHKGDPVLWTHFLHQRHQTSTIKNPSHKQHAPPKTAQQVCAFLGLIRYCGKFIKNFAKMAKPLTLVTHQKVNFEWTPIHHIAFLKLKESIIQAPILCYPDPTKWYIVYIDASDDAFGAQLPQEHDGMEFPIAFLSHTPMGIQRKWNITEQEAYSVY